MELITKKSILIIAPSLIAESLSLKLTSLDTNLNITLNSGSKNLNPDLIIWNILNYQSEELIRLELLKLKERWDESKILVIFSGELVNKTKLTPSLNSEGLLLNPSADKVLESINIISEEAEYLTLKIIPLSKLKKKKNLLLIKNFCHLVSNKLILR